MAEGERPDRRPCLAPRGDLERASIQPNHAIMPGTQAGNPYQSRLARVHQGSLYIPKTRIMELFFY